MSHIRPSPLARGALASLLAALAGCSGGEATPSASRRATPPAVSRAAVDAAVCSSESAGAHLAHEATSFRAGVACAECHACATRDEPVAFGELARAGGASPVWDPATRTCSGVYCHGATLATAPAPIAWVYADPERPRPPAEACSTCHAYPPAAPHPTASRCDGCHPETVTADGTIDVAGGHHVDGVLDVTCNTCHAFPPATGAHVVHAGRTGAGGYGDLSLGGDAASYAYGCGHCHPLDDARHDDGTLQVELRNAAAPAGTIKARASASAGYDAASGTCSGVYCHSSGQEAPAYALTPPWTSEAPLACDGCHGNPPAYPSGGAGAIDANSHLGLADDGYEFGHFLGVPGVWHTTKHGGAGAAPITCQTCHFETVDPANVAPGGFYYLDTTGSYALPGGDPYRVDSGWSTQLDCTTCHTGAPGAPPQGAGRVLPRRHVNGARDVVFDPRTALPAVAGLPAAPNTPAKPYWVAQAGGVPWPAAAVWNGTTVSYDLSGLTYDRATKTCSSNGCHLVDSPVWGRPYGWGEGFDNCNRCHPMW